jgi:excisionase family DNA binding protein
MAYVTLDQIVAQYPIALPTLRDWINKGKLSAFKPGRRLLVRPADVEAIIASAEIGAVRAERARRARKAGAR